VNVLLRRLATAATIGLLALVALPATAVADCNGPGCGVVDPPVEGLVIVMTIAIVVASFTVMAVAGARRR
jgi:hypothetical protein